MKSSRNSFPAPTLGAVAGDLMSLAGVPGSGALGSAIDTLVRRRTGIAEDILLEELKRERPGILLDDDEVAKLFRYIRAAREGAARINLRLQAQGPRLSADAFLVHASILDGLRRQEIILLGAMFRHWHRSGPEAADAAGDSGEEAAARAELVPDPFPDDQALFATSTALLRTGLLLPVARYGRPSHVISPLAEDLMGVVRVEDALHREDGRNTARG